MPLSALTFLALSACFFAPSVEGDGDLRTEVREVPPAEGVVLEGAMDVTVTASDRTTVEVTCDANLLPYIETEVVDGALWVRTTHDGLPVNLDPTGPCVVAVGLPQLQVVRLAGSGLIEVLGQGSVLLGELDLTGSGEVVVAPTIVGARLDVALRGSGDLTLAAVEVASVDVALSGSGDLTVGVRPRPDWLALAQVFQVNTIGGGSGGFRAGSYTRVQLSAVHDLDARWSVQVGANSIIAGRRALAENSVMLAVWRRF
jgi:hypothetical protein